MTEIFDFAAAVAKAQTDYREETENVTFVDLSSPSAQAEMAAWYRDASPAWWERQVQAGGPVNAEELAGWRTTMPGFSEYDHATGKKIMAVNSNPSDHPLLKWGGVARTARHVFNHELGHIIVPNGIPLVLYGMSQNDAAQEEMTKAENAAETFAILRGLWEGSLTTEDAEIISMMSSMTGLSQQQYMMSRAVDEAITEGRRCHLKDLSAEDIQALAQRYSETYAPNRDEQKFLLDNTLWSRIDKVTRKSVDLTREQWLENLSDICGARDKDSFSFYLAAKILTEALNKGKLPALPQDKTFNVAGEKWDEMRRALSARLGSNASLKVRLPV